LVKLDTLVSDVYALLESKKLSDTGLVEKYSKTVGEVLGSRFEDKARLPTLRMSNIGRPLRQLWYELNGYKGEEVRGQTLLKFAYGDATESLLVFLAQASGHTVERLQEEVEVDGVKGHIDCVIDGTLVDIKSCSAYSFRKFQDGSLLEEGNDPFGYVAQLSGYAHALNLPAAWIAFDKQSGEICVLKLPKETIDEYDVASRIGLVRTTCSQSEPPGRCYQDEADGKSGNRKLAVSCSYCAYKFECWKDSNNGEGLKTYIYSTGPRYLTNVTREPKVFSINNESNS
jgi:hypothetical protein